MPQPLLGYGSPQSGPLLQRRPVLGDVLLGDGRTLSARNPSLRERVVDMFRRNLFTDDRAGQDKAEYLNRVAETIVPPYGLTSGVNDATNSVAQGNYGAAALQAGLMMVPGPKGERAAIRAYHGSPHDFDKFDLSKIGTGEGAQAYGHGLYFADSEKVAKSYRDDLSRQILVDGKPLLQSNKMTGVTGDSYLDDLIVSSNGDMESVVGELRQNLNELKVKGMRADETAAALAKAEDLLNRKAVTTAVPGRMYEVQINADPNSFLDWDKPLSEQPKNVQAALADIPLKRSDHGSYLWQGTVNKKNAEGAIGEHMADPMPAIKTGTKAAMEHLRDSGVPGIKYRDTNSRDGRENATWNYVVFDDKLISIVRKYGIAGASVALGYNVLDGVNDAQASELQKADKEYRGKATMFGGGGW